MMMMKFNIFLQNLTTTIFLIVKNSNKQFCLRNSKFFFGETRNEKREEFLVVGFVRGGIKPHGTGKMWHLESHDDDDDDNHTYE